MFRGRGQGNYGSSGRGPGSPPPPGGRGGVGEGRFPRPNYCSPFGIGLQQPRFPYSSSLPLRPRSTQAEPRFTRPRGSLPESPRPHVRQPDARSIRLLEIFNKTTANQQLRSNLSRKLKEQESLVFGQKIEVHVLWIEGPNELYLLKAADLGSLNDLDLEIDQLENKEPFGEEEAKAGDYCLSFYEDQEEGASRWHRAQIRELHTESGHAAVVVFHLDYGIQSVVKLQDLKILHPNPNLWSVPPLATKVTLTGLDDENLSVHESAAADYLRELVDRKSCFFTPTAFDEETSSYLGVLEVEGVGNIVEAIKAYKPTQALESPTIMFTPTNTSATWIPHQAATAGAALVSQLPPPEPEPDPVVRPFPLPQPYPFQRGEMTRRELSPSPVESQAYIITNWLDNLERLYIMGWDAKKTTLLELHDEINEYVQCVHKDSAKMQILHSEPPQLDNVYIAYDYASPDQKYFRGFIERVMLDDYFEVRDVDSGKIRTQHINDLLPMIPAVFEIPIIGHEIKLAGIENGAKLILPSHFHTLIRELIKAKTVFTVDEILGFEPASASNSDSHSAITRPIVSLKQRSDSLAATATAFLSSQINGLRKWKWEELVESGKCKTDGDIVQREKLSSGAENTEPELLVNPKLPIGVDLDVIVRKLAPPLKPGNCPLVRFELVSTEMSELKEVLESQAERYMQMVEASKHCPGNRELVWVLPPEGEIGAGKWQRCFRLPRGPELPETYLGIDANVSYLPEESRPGFQFREMTSEFKQLPACMILAELSDPEAQDVVRRAFLKTFTIDKRLRIKIMPEMRESTYVFECSEFGRRISEEFMNSFA